MNCDLKQFKKQSICLKKVEKIQGLGYALKYVNCPTIQNPKKFLIPYYRNISTSIINYEK